MTLATSKAAVETEAPAKPAGSEWRQHWPLALAAMIGLSLASVAGYSLTVFLGPLTREFGWSRAQAVIGLTIVALLAVPLSPVVGAVVDRWGSRRLALPGVVLSGLAFAAFGLANGSTVQWIVLWVAYAIVALSIKTTVWTAAVSSVFSVNRGLALAVTLCGTAVAQTLAPLIAQWLVSTWGWRQAFVWMGLGWGAVAFLLVLFFFFDARDHERDRVRQGGAAAAPAALGGLTLGQAYRTPVILRIAAAVLLTTLLGSAVTIHKVPILTELGLSLAGAAWIASSAGVAGIAGKILTGWLYDRTRSDWISPLSMGLPAVAFGLMLPPLRSTESVIAGMVLLGYASGAQLQVVTYLVSRHGGLRHFGKIFGVLASLLAAGTGVGPLLAGILYDQSGAYAPLLMLGVPVGLLCGALVARLGPYPDWSTPAAQS